MLNLQVENWHYLHGEPLFNARIKQELSDFKVQEHLSFEPSGTGEHTLLHIEKTGLNTAFVAENLAKFGQLPLRNVSYAGRKDKFATTSQWFGIYHGGKQKANWSEFNMPNVRILNITHNDRKLRTGAIKSNYFEIVLRDLTPFNTTTQQALGHKIQSICERGVPNYFGNQRFGELLKDDGSAQLGGNLRLAEKLINGEDIRNRNKRSMAISALRSWLFNHFVSQRLSTLPYLGLLEGDVFSLTGTNSFFVSSLINAQENVGDKKHQLGIAERLQQRDIMLTAPLWGAGKLDSKSEALEFEKRIANCHPVVCETLETLKLEQQRRPILLFPKDFSAEISDNSATLRFSLPSGCFATSVLREIANINVGKTCP